MISSGRLCEFSDKQNGVLQLMKVELSQLNPHHSEAYSTHCGKFIWFMSLVFEILNSG